MLAIKIKPITDGAGVVDSSNMSPDGNPATAQRLPRLLLVTSERLLILDNTHSDELSSSGKVLNSEAIVKSNHHLTELVKLTFS